MHPQCSIYTFWMSKYPLMGWSVGPASSILVRIAQRALLSHTTLGCSKMWTEERVRSGDRVRDVERDLISATCIFPTISCCPRWRLVARPPRALARHLPLLCHPLHELNPLFPSLLRHIAPTSLPSRTPPGLVRLPSHAKFLLQLGPMNREKSN